MISYPVTITPGEGGLVLVTFPDVPEAVALDSGEEAALDRAAEVLDLVLGGYAAEHRPIPLPSDIAQAPCVTTERFAHALPSGYSGFRVPG
ncbi:MAG TPA: type II toxin-antitoxin system HicB family antitoxin [Allosphingosinicella sp.]